MVGKRTATADFVDGLADTLAAGLLVFFMWKILDRLQEETWEDPVEDNTLSVHISRLRAAVGPGFIETVRGFGYRFKEEVREDGYRKGTM